jgi:hypothetical protein
MIRIRPLGMMELQNQLSDGLEAVGQEIYQVAHPSTPIDTGELQASLHVDNEHSREWPKPAVFVATATGDGFFVHEGTVDTPAQPWLSQALDVVRGRIPSIIRRETKGKEYGIFRR